MGTHINLDQFERAVDTELLRDGARDVAERLRYDAALLERISRIVDAGTSEAPAICVELAKAQGELRKRIERLAEVVLVAAFVLGAMLG